MARVEKGLMYRKVVGRGGGAPGSNATDHEGRQSAEVGKKAKAMLDGTESPKGNESTPPDAPTRKLWANNIIADGERRMSISADKTRERGRSRLQYPNSKY